MASRQPLRFAQTRKVHWPTYPDHRHDRACVDGIPRKMPGGRNGRITSRNQFAHRTIRCDRGRAFRRAGDRRRASLCEAASSPRPERDRRPCRRSGRTRPTARESRRLASPLCLRCVSAVPPCTSAVSPLCLCCTSIVPPRTTACSRLHSAYNSLQPDRISGRFEAQNRLSREERSCRPSECPFPAVGFP